MLNYLETYNTLFARGVPFDVNEYLFTLQVVLGEDPTTAYAITYGAQDFKKVSGTEEEESYLISLKKTTDTLLSQQEIKQLKEILGEQYRTEVQSKASNLKDFKFSAEETVKMLSNLLHERSSDLESASVRDVISLIKMLAEQGALEGTDGFQKHFITIHPKFNALCGNCNRELSVFAGIDCTCEHCGQVYRWAEDEQRFYPQPLRL